MIDINRYEIDDDVVWIWKWSDDAYDDEKKRWVSGVEHANWQLWEYKECPAEKGGYEIYRKGEDDESTHEPWNQLLPEIPSIEWNKKMEAIQDVPFLIKEVKRLREQLLQGVMYMHMTATQTKDGRIYNAKKFERQVREAIE